MRYFVTLGDREVAVDVEAAANGALDVRVDGRRIDVDVAVLAEALSIRIDGRVVDLTVEGEPPLVGIVASGVRAYVRAESERMRAAARARGGRATGGDDVVRSPMPGRVVRVLVETGAEVEAGAALVVVEAMKMENELRAARRGKVAEVCVRAGETVERGAALVRLG